MIIRISDIRQSGYCVSGARDWFNRHGLDFKDFLKNGIESKTLLEEGDELARKVVTEAQRRQNDGR